MMWLAPLAVLGASAALIMLAAVLAPRHRVLALVLSAVVLLALPWLAGPIPLVRGLLALNFLSVFRVIDLVRSREASTWSAPRRIGHALSFVDTRLLRRQRPRLDLRGSFAALAWGGLAAVALHLAGSSPPRWAVPPLVVRLGAGLVFTYAAIEAAYAVLRVGHRVFGFKTPPLHIRPLASLTVTELWGMRWARPVSHWLRMTCFLPLARRGHPALGMLLGFLVSASGHAYPVLVAVGPAMAAMMFAYFVVQGAVVAAEAPLGVARWPRALRRAWTLVIMVGTSPLFVEPCLRVVLP
ncbi:MAG: hypothetical protein WKG00_25300 [Polyangiaceae bacterium]